MGTELGWGLVDKMHYSKVADSEKAKSVQARPCGGASPDGGKGWRIRSLAVCGVNRGDPACEQLYGHRT